MAEVKEAKVPDIGDYTGVPVIEILVKPGDSVTKDQGLVTLESDKATMEVPSSIAGVVREIKVRIGDEISEGTVVALIESADAAAPALPSGVAQKAPPAVAKAETPAASKPAAAVPGGDLHEVKVPDIGDYSNVPVIEVLVKAGDTVTKDQGLVTLESDKATMEVPSSIAGVVKEIKVKVGDEVSAGVVVALIEAAGTVASAATSATVSASAAPQAAVPGASSDRLPASPSAAARDANQGIAQAQQPRPSSPPINFGADTVLPDKVPYASPAVRLFARELGVDLSRVTGSERKGRIGREDVQKFVKSALAAGAGAAPASAAAGSGGLNLLPWPKVDFSKFGEVETRPLSRIQKISGANLARNWAMIPHVTHNDDADITELEALRVALNKEYEKAGVKFTMLGFLIKALVAGLKKFPQFNASLDASGENLVLKKYFNIGFAADTPNGLVVPVLKDADKKGVVDIARETSALAAKARDGKLGPAEMSGGCISISSLGGIGGTSFSPIVNAPEVAILGVTKSAMKPVWDGKAFQPRLILPLSLSYDHRVIDGALAARFTAYLAQSARGHAARDAVIGSFWIRNKGVADMQKVNLGQKLAQFSEHWDPRVVGELNGQQVKLVKLKGEFVWHHHDHEDELFLVVKGSLTMRLRDQDVAINEGEFLIVPRGVEHQPVAEREVEVLLFEPAGTLNTGNVRSERTRENLKRL